MGTTSSISGLEQRIEQQFGLNRGVLLVVGVACTVLGVVAIALPMGLFGSFIRMIGLILLGSGFFKGAQLLLGRRSPSARERGWSLIVLQVAIVVLMGLLLLNHWRASVGLVTSAFGALFLIEGSVLVYMALRSPTVQSGRLLTFCGLATAVIGMAILLRLVDDPLRWAGVFVGIKLLLFGVTLVWISLNALRSDSSLLYGETITTPKTDELYAVYFGPAFHLGLFIVVGEDVDYITERHLCLCI